MLGNALAVLQRVAVIEEELELLNSQNQALERDVARFQQRATLMEEVSCPAVCYCTNVCAQDMGSASQWCRSSNGFEQRVICPQLKKVCCLASTGAEPGKEAAMAGVQ